MIQKDYIERLIQEFARALSMLLNRPELEKRREALQAMYAQYVGPYEVLFNANADEMFDFMEQFAPQERLQRMEMLAELYMAEADTVGKVTADSLMERAYLLFDYIQQKGRIFSFSHQQKMQTIRERLKQI